MANAKSKRLIHAVVHGNALKAVAGIQKPVAVVESSAMWPRDVNESVIVERKRSKLQKVTQLGYDGQMLTEASTQRRLAQIQVVSG